jgi:hypothetical protein
MDESTNSNYGYVYVLEVKDIDLPVCKIGMTTRTPYERCNEINKSSTGDFIWAVAHYISVDNCKKLESLVHFKLAPLRQQGREFFNINADTANTALLSILENQVEIKKITLDEIKPSKLISISNIKKKKNMSSFKPIDTEYAELLQRFTSILGVKGKPFGQLNKPTFGMSDGNNGVQWNLLVSTESNIIRIGVNLEGLKYNNWPIAKFIQSELVNPKLFETVHKLNDPENTFISFSRDAWQGPSRLAIVEKYLGGKEFTLAEITLEKWTNMLNEALGCLDKEKDYLGRAKQIITFENQQKNGAQVQTKNVSPHLTIWSPLNFNESMQEQLEHKIANLKPIYDWVKEVSE